MKLQNLKIQIPVSLKVVFAKLLLIVVLFSCSTEKNRFLNRAYHSVNTMYNGYFNARESYNNALITLSENHLDNYENVLSIFKYGSSQNRSAIEANMEIAYEKCSRVIRKHSMNINGVEYNRYIDNAYFLIARSHFFKEDYNLAIIMFEYIIREYDTPLKYMSKIWIAKCRHELEQYEQAQQILEIVQQNYDEGLLEKDAKKLFNLVKADHHIRLNQYSRASGFLEEAISLTNKRELRARYTFILGQVYYRAEEYLQAQNSFARVLRMNPDFDMAFRARINMAMSYDPRSGDLKSIKNELDKMLRADRNKEYRDEIYYAMGMLELRQDNKAEAIDFFLESTKVSEENRFQKGLSFLKLGELHFEMPEYLKASIYYDSVVVFMSSDYDKYEEIQEKQILLAELASHIRVIERQDSLQRLAGMSQADRNRLVDNMINELRAQDRIAREEEIERQRQMQQMAARGGTRGGSRDGDGSWYFYNPTAMNFGSTEFATKWGDRPLDDLWRISNKQVMAFGFEDGDTDAEGEQADEAARYNRETYLANIPTTPEMMEASNKNLAEAYYYKGLIFKNRLKDLDYAIQSFGTLVNRFPEFEQNIYAYYYLYTLNTMQGDVSSANTYKNRLISEFPESDFAKILNDPNYAENIRNRKSRAENLYTQSYNAFLAGNYNVVFRNVESIDTLDIENNLKAKFLYLKAISHGRNDEQIKMKEQLAYIVQYHFESTVYEKANHLLNLLNEREMLAMENNVEDDVIRAEQIESIFAYNPNAVHFFAIVIETRRIQGRELRNKLNRHNRDNHAESNLSISNISLNERQQLYTVTNFNGAELAMDYYSSLIEHEVLKDFDMEHYNAFLISVENYPLFYQEKDLDEYLKFYTFYYFQ